MTRPYCVGLTGGVGSGKSAAARMFTDLGAGLVDTDAIAHQLTGPAGGAMADIVAAFGAELRQRDGSLDRAAMRALVFRDPEARRRLEALLHPLIREEARRLLFSLHAPYVLLAVPLLVENLAAYRPFLDRVAVLDCAETLQIRRVAARPGLDPAQARAIVAAQSSRAARLAIADDVIENDGELADLERRVRQLHKRYLGLAAGKR